MDKKTSGLTAKKEKDLVLPQEYFNKNQNVGLSGITSEDVPVPSLGIIQSNSKMKDDEGRPYIPGRFFYKALRKEYETVSGSILVISKRELPSYTDKNVLERTYMVLGVIEPGFMPFMLYCKSSAYFAVRQFIGEVKARKYPMYSLKIELSTEKRQNDMGEWFVPVFKITGVRDNPDELVMLEGLAKDYDMNQDNLRSEEEVKKEAAANEGEIVPEPDQTDQGVEPEHIPF